MGFFGLQTNTKPVKSIAKGVSVELLHRTECRSCPLNRAECTSPKMEPAGTSDPLIYILGAAPSERADATGRPWAGRPMKLLKRCMPPQALARVRWGNVVRTFPGRGPTIKDKAGDDIETTRVPTQVEIECCRPSVVRDIERTKPVAIFGFGGVPLRWAANETHAYQWQGRRMPVQIGKHTCWYYPFVDPVDAVKDRRWEGHVSDNEFTFEKQLTAAVREVFNEELPVPFIHTEEFARRDVEIIMGYEGASDLRRIEKVLRECADSKTTGLDYETNSLRPYNKDAYLLTAAVATKLRAVAFPFEHSQAKWTSGELDRLDAMFTEFLMSADTIKVVHQLAFEMEWSAVKFGRKVLRAGKWACSLSQAYVIDETQGLLALEALTTQYYGFNIKELSKVNRKNLDAEPLDVVLTYNALDAKYHRNLYHTQRPILHNLNMLEVYEHQVRRIPTLVLTQMKGIPVDQQELEAFASKYKKDVKDAEQEINQLDIVTQYRRKYGEVFRPSASGDVAKMITMLGHKVGKTVKGGEQTDEAALKKIDHPISKLILRWRKASKILSTYVAPVTPGSPHLFDDGLAHPIISTTKVRTWRTSSEDPNVQNWPKRGPNVVIRRVIGKRGYKVVAFDYAGIQARNVAMETRDPFLVKSFFDGYDIHKDWVEKLAEIYPKWAFADLKTDHKVFKAARSGVKNQFVFPTFFGAQPKGISKNLAGSGRCAVPIEAVEELQTEFFREFAMIKPWHQRIQRDYRKHGYVTGLSGHRRHAPIGYNEIINSPIQADESLIVLTAMSALSELDYKLYQPSLEIHDDLTFLWPENEVDARADVVIREMVKPRFDWINVPLVVEMSIGDNWCDLKEIGSFRNVGTDSYKEGK